MESQTERILVRAKGDYACFSCPDFGAERVSYPVMTPSAARGLLESIFWKPEIKFLIEEIRVLREIKYQSMKRKEKMEKMNLNQWMNPICGSTILINTSALIDVEYVIVCRIALSNPSSHDNVQDALSKYYEMFTRRLRKGQCFQRPYLGMREFVADVREATGDEPAIDFSQNLGMVMMGWQNTGSKRLPRFSRVTLEQGVMKIPAEAKNWS